MPRPGYHWFAAILLGSTALACSIGRPARADTLAPLSLIPLPAQLSRAEGSFRVDATTTVERPSIWLTCWRSRVGCCCR